MLLLLLLAKINIRNSLSMLLPYFSFLPMLVHSSVIKSIISRSRPYFLVTELYTDLTGIDNISSSPGLTLRHVRRGGRESTNLPVSYTISNKARPNV